MINKWLKKVGWLGDKEREEHFVDKYKDDILATLYEHSKKIENLEKEVNHINKALIETANKVLDSKEKDKKHRNRKK